MTKKNFMPKSAETLKTEIIAELGIDYEGSEEMVDKLVSRELKGEQFKASLHQDKNKHLGRKEIYKQVLVEAGLLDPKTGELKKPKGEKKEPKGEDYSLQDIRALQDVHDEDIEEIRDFAKYKGISISDAKKHPVVITLLADKQEKRKTAEASNTGGGRGGSQPPSYKKILEDAEKGIIPENPEDLANARAEAKKAGKKI